MGLTIEVMPQTDCRDNTVTDRASEASVASLVVTTRYLVSQGEAATDALQQVLNR